jgi:hypothetical protein
MSKPAPREDVLIKKIRNLRDDRRLTRAANKLAEKAFRSVWDNPDDAAYDRL